MNKGKKWFFDYSNGGGREEVAARPRESRALRWQVLCVSNFYSSVLAMSAQQPIHLPNDDGSEDEDELVYDESQDSPSSEPM
jgi:hypothetical protein